MSAGISLKRPANLGLLPTRSPRGKAPALGFYKEEIMSRIEIEARPYDEEGILHLLISASSFGFSGFVEIYSTPKTIADFGTKLIEFPQSIHEKVTFEYGDNSGKWISHLVLQARVIDGVGHSALYVRMQSFVGIPGNAMAEFYVPSEPASLNDFGSALVNWVSVPDEPFVWQPRA